MFFTVLCHQKLTTPIHVLYYQVTVQYCFSLLVAVQMFCTCELLTPAMLTHGSSPTPQTSYCREPTTEKICTCINILNIKHVKVLTSTVLCWSNANNLKTCTSKFSLFPLLPSFPYSFICSSLRY